MAEQDENNAEDADGDEEEEAEEDQGGMVMPADVLAAKMAEGPADDGENSSNGSDSDASSGLEDAGSELEIDDLSDKGSQQDDETEKAAGDSEKAAGSGGASHLAKPKLYDQSPEWKQLCLLESEHKLTLLRLPELAGCGVSRHPAKNFWSARYPGHMTKSVSWGAHGRTPLQCLAKVLRYVVRVHIAENPHLHDMHSWKIQMQNLVDFEAQ